MSPGEGFTHTPEVVRAFEAVGEGLEFIAFGPHVAGDGEGVDDPWVS